MIFCCHSRPKTECLFAQRNGSGRLNPWRWPKGSKTFIWKNWSRYLRIDTFFFIETLIREFLDAGLDGTRDSSCLVA